MSNSAISRHNVGRIAERIVSNELEYRGFRVSDLNKEGLSANADLLAVKNGIPWQVQVKGATEDNGWWVNYGFAHQKIIERKRTMYNAADGFYRAQVVILVCVKSPTEYRCVVLPVDTAEAAAQLNLDHAFRTPKRDGSPKKPGKAWTSIGYMAKTNDAVLAQIRNDEQTLLLPYVDDWGSAFNE